MHATGSAHAYSGTERAGVAGFFKRDAFEIGRSFRQIKN